MNERDSPRRAIEVRRASAAQMPAQHRNEVAAGTGRCLVGSHRILADQRAEEAAPPTIAVVMMMVGSGRTAGGHALRVC